MVCDPYAYMRSYHSSHNVISMTISFGHGFTSMSTLEVELEIKVSLAYFPKVSSRLSLAFPYPLEHLVLEHLVLELYLVN